MLMRLIPAFMLLLISLQAVPQTKLNATQAKQGRPKIFDPARDAAKDIDAAIKEATRTGKRVLIDVGGDWCIWCREMERYFEEHAALRELRNKYFVTVKVNYSPQNRNEAVLSRYPKIPGYPHLYVLDKNGAVLHSQDTGQLEDGRKSYNLEKFTAFLTRWVPK